MGSTGTWHGGLAACPFGPCPMSAVGPSFQDSRWVGRRFTARSPICGFTTQGPSIWSASTCGHSDDTWRHPGFHSPSSTLGSRCGSGEQCLSEAHQKTWGHDPQFPVMAMPQYRVQPMSPQSRSQRSREPAYAASYSGGAALRTDNLLGSYGGQLPSDIRFLTRLSAPRHHETPDPYFCETSTPICFSPRWRTPGSHILLCCHDLQCVLASLARTSAMGTLVAYLGQTHANTTCRVKRPTSWRSVKDNLPL
jgi:hypothetical protein